MRWVSTAILSICLIAVLMSCDRRQKEPKALRLSAQVDPDALDPRLARDLVAASTLNMLFEGLLRIDSSGSLEPGAAKSYTLSPDGYTYTFTLRDAHWSNGEPVTSQDFAYSWRTILDPKFPAPNAYQLYPIKNAAAAKRGDVPLDSVGIQTPDDKTLVITLEQPTAHFLELTTFHALFPINRHLDAAVPQWNEAHDPKMFSGNGPFKLAHWSRQNELVAVKNEHYWDAKAVKLDEIRIATLEEHTALRLFESGMLDRAGSPLSLLPPDAVGALKQSGQFAAAPAAGTHWLRLNTQREPLSDPRVRRALALAIDRQTIVENILQGGQQPALAIVPAIQGWNVHPHFKDHDLAEARRLIDAVRAEKELKPLVLTYGNNERHHKLAQELQEQWRKGLGIEVTLEAVEAKTFFERLRQGSFTIANGAWFADFRDPLNFLAVFKEKNNGTNNTGWSHERYRQLLDAATGESNAKNRQQLLASAEEILMAEMPVIPIFFYTFNYVQNPRVRGLGLSELGILNARNAELVGSE